MKTDCPDTRLDDYSRDIVAEIAITIGRDADVADPVAPQANILRNVLSQMKISSRNPVHSESKSPKMLACGGLNPLSPDFRLIELLSPTSPREPPHPLGGSRNKYTPWFQVCCGEKGL